MHNTQFHISGKRPIKRNRWIGQLIRSVDCEVTGPLWRHQKAVSCLGLDKSISDARVFEATRSTPWRCGCYFERYEIRILMHALMFYNVFPPLVIFCSRGSQLSPFCLLNREPAFGERNAWRYGDPRACGSSCSCFPTFPSKIRKVARWSSPKGRYQWRRHCKTLITKSCLVCNLFQNMLNGGIHDDVINWKHLPHYKTFVWGIHR